MSKIEWTGKTWNPIVGCSLASPGCTNCYAMKMAGRLEAMGLPAYQGTTQRTKNGFAWTGKIGVASDDVLMAPLRRKKPTTYFVNSMSDLFHPNVPYEVIDRVFAVMALCPQHIFQVLTKRGDRMREYLASEWFGFRVRNAMQEIRPVAVLEMALPLPNVWLGVSVEDQARADQRIPDLLVTPAAVRFLSCEPLLGPVNLNSLGVRSECDHEDAYTEWDTNATICSDCEEEPLLDWVIAGGESGPGARPMHPDWARSLRDQCAAAGVPFFFKQWGAYLPAGQVASITGKWQPGGDNPPPLCTTKKNAGRLLDGVEHEGMPPVGVRP